MARLFKTFILVSGLFVALAASLLYQFFFKALPLPAEGYSYELERGQVLSHLSNKLQADNIISNARLLNGFARLKGLDKKIHAGEYHLAQGSTLLDLLAQIEKGETLKRSITFVEGWTVKQLLAALLEEDALDSKNISDQDALRVSLGMQEQHLEGLFFADTYFFSKGTSTLSLLKHAHQKLETVLQEEWQQRSDNLPLNSAYEALILASIVERETGIASERPLIAGVFVNRLKKGMRLQTDPTVIYGMGDSYQGKIGRKHLETYTPYNTYRISGLPPTPIAIVGRESIHAVMHPLQTQHLYFVAKGDGSHYFSPTLKEHQEAVRKFQLNRPENYRSTPARLN